jgi:DNA-binding NarL/FixJ family response regulator
LCIGFQEGDSARLKERFSADGIEAVFEASPSHAIYNRLKQREFDLLFLRIDATPIELIRTIKGIRSMTGSLLIFAAQDERDAVTALEAGADAVLPARASPELTCRQALAVFRRQTNRCEDR